MFTAELRFPGGRRETITFRTSGEVLDRASDLGASQVRLFGETFIRLRGEWVGLGYATDATCQLPLTPGSED